MLLQPAYFCLQPSDFRIWFRIMILSDALNNPLIIRDGRLIFQTALMHLGQRIQAVRDAWRFLHGKAVLVIRHCLIYHTQLFRRSARIICPYKSIGFMLFVFLPIFRSSFFEIIRTSTLCINFMFPVSCAPDGLSITADRTIENVEKIGYIRL